MLQRNQRCGNWEPPVTLFEIQSLPPKILSNYRSHFTIVYKDKIQEMLEGLNKVLRNLHFTMDYGELPLLNLGFTWGEKIFLLSFIESLHEQRTVPEYSNHSHLHKMAPFYAMIHILFPVPLCAERFIKEKRYIFDIGVKNGFQHRHLKAPWTKRRNSKCARWHPSSAVWKWIEECGSHTLRFRRNLKDQ